MTAVMRARAAIDPLHQAAVREFKPGLMGCKAFAIGLVPLVITLFYVLLIDEPPASHTPAEAPPLVAIWQALQGAWDDIAGLVSARDPTPSAPPGEAAAHGIYSAEILFGAAALLYVFLVYVTLVGQVRAIQRFGEVYWPRSSDPKSGDQFDLSPRTSPLDQEAVVIVVNLIGFSAIATVAYQFAPLALPWVPSINFLPKALVCGPDWLRAVCDHATMAQGWQDVAIVFLHALLIGATLAVIAVTAYGALLISRMYPRTKTVSKLHHNIATSYRSAAEAISEAAQKSEDAGAQQADGNAKKLSENETIKKFLTDERGFKPEELVEMTDLIWRFAPPGTLDDGTDRAKHAPTNTSLSATNTAEVVTSLSRALLILLIVALVVLSLGFDAIEADLSGPDAYKAAVAASNNAWLLALGVGFSICLALVYYIPTVRLNLFIYSEADRKKEAEEKPTSWTGKIAGALWKGAEFDLKPQEKKKKAKAKIDRDMTFYIGADHAKLTTILDSDRFLGAYHAMLEKGLPEQVRTLLVLLAPTFFSGILSLLG